MKHVYSSCKPLKENRKKLYKEPDQGGGLFGATNAATKRGAAADGKGDGKGGKGGGQVAATTAAAPVEEDTTLSVVIPPHILLDKSQQFYVPVDRAIRVLQAVFRVRRALLPPRPSPVSPVSDCLRALYPSPIYPIVTPPPSHPFVLRGAEREAGVQPAAQAVRAGGEQGHCAEQERHLRQRRHHTGALK